MKNPLAAARRPLLAAALAAALLAGGVPAFAVPAADSPAPAAASADHARYLDLPLSGADGESNGGYNRSLPTDPDVLLPFLESARASGVSPTRYRALLLQYWLAVGARNAGIDLDDWDPSRGLAANEKNLENTFRHYTRLQLANDDFLWTGQGGLAGPSFAAGIMDVDIARVVMDVREARDIVAAMTGVVGDAAGPAFERLPADVRALLEVGPVITGADIAWFQQRVIAMSKHIFMDLIPMHEAYLAGGATAIAEFDAVGFLDDNARTAWAEIATGDADLVAAGNAKLLHREQHQSIGDQWDAVSGYKGAVGRSLTYLSTVAADPAIPGVRPPREISPLVIALDDAGARTAPGAGDAAPGCRLQTPLPAFNWADRDARWEYIEGEMLPKYRWLKENDPARWRAALSAPMEWQIISQRAVLRLPQLLGSVASTTKPLCP